MVNSNGWAQKKVFKRIKFFTNQVYGLQKIGSEEFSVEDPSLSNRLVPRMSLAN